MGMRLDILKYLRRSRNLAVTLVGHQCMILDKTTKESKALNGTNPYGVLKQLVSGYGSTLARLDTNGNCTAYGPKTAPGNSISFTLSGVSEIFPSRTYFSYKAINGDAYIRIARQEYDTGGDYYYNIYYFYKIPYTDVLYIQDAAVIYPNSGGSAYSYFLITTKTKSVMMRILNGIDSSISYTEVPYYYLFKNGSCLYGVSEDGSISYITEDGTGYIYNASIMNTIYTNISISNPLVAVGNSIVQFKNNTVYLDSNYNAYVKKTSIVKAIPQLDNDSFIIVNQNNELEGNWIGTNQTGVLMTNVYLEPSDTYLLQSGSVIKSFNGTTFSNIGSEPITDAMFESGFSDFTGLTKDKLATLSSPKLLLKKSESVTPSTKITGTPLPKLILANSDILLSGTVSSLDKFVLTANNSGTAVMKIIMSFDSGTTWKAYNASTSTWVTVDKNTLSDVKSKGNAISELNAISSGVWYDAVLNAGKKVRFGYYMEANATTDVVETDLLTMQVDMNGKWKMCSLDAEYSFGYTGTSSVQVKLLASGDYRITIV